MPTTLRGLAALGLNGWPAWWVRVGGIDAERCSHLSEADRPHLHSGYYSGMSYRYRAILPKIQGMEGCCGGRNTKHTSVSDQGHGRRHSAASGSTAQDTSGRNVSGAYLGRHGKRPGDHNAKVSVDKEELLAKNVYQQSGEERRGDKERRNNIQSKDSRPLVNDIERDMEKRSMQDNNVGVKNASVTEKREEVEREEVLGKLVDI